MTEKIFTLCGAFPLSLDLPILEELIVRLFYNELKSGKSGSNSKLCHYLFAHSRLFALHAVHVANARQKRVRAVLACGVNHGVPRNSRLRVFRRNRALHRKISSAGRHRKAVQTLRHVLFDIHRFNADCGCDLRGDILQPESVFLGIADGRGNRQAANHDAHHNGEPRIRVPDEHFRRNHNSLRKFRVFEICCDSANPFEHARDCRNAPLGLQGGCDSANNDDFQHFGFHTELLLLQA